MSWGDDDFERDMVTYSELETYDVPVELVPQSIKQYEQRIQLNNACSIFDTDYSLSETSNVSASTSSVIPASESKHKSILKDEDHVIKITSGRGRGGRNIIHKPGGLGKSGLPDDEQDVIQRLRRVAPIGYGNEITETAVLAHRKAKQGKSEQSSPAISECSSPATLRKTTAPEPKKEAEFETANSLSRTSPSSCRSDDIEIFDSFASQCQNTSSSPQLTAHSNGCAKLEDIAAKSNTGEATITNGHATQSPLIGTPSTAVPLSEILKPAREMRKQLLEQRYASDTEYYENELASRRAIQELYREELQKKHPSSRSSCSSATSGSSQDEVLTWRKRTNSPPRFAWGNNHKRRGGNLNLNSCDDFPPLK